MCERTLLTLRAYLVKHIVQSVASSQRIATIRYSSLLHPPPFTPTLHVSLIFVFNIQRAAPEYLLHGYDTVSALCLPSSIYTYIHHTSSFPSHLRLTFLSFFGLLDTRKKFALVRLDQRTVADLCHVTFPPPPHQPRPPCPTTQPKERRSRLERV